MVGTDPVLSEGSGIHVSETHSVVCAGLASPMTVLLKVNMNGGSQGIL